MNLDKKWKNRDEVRGWELLNFAAGKGHGQSQLRLGMMYLKNEDYENAEAFLRLAAHQNAIAQYKLGRLYFDKGEELIGIKWIDAAAKNDYLLAHCFLGKYFFEKEDYEIAFTYLVPAVLSGHSSSIEIVNDPVFQTNREKVIDKITKIAESGKSKYQYWLGSFYCESPFVERDDAKSFYWYKRASELGHENATAKLGTYYLLGKGTEKNIKKAIQCFRKAKANPISLYSMGVILTEGIYLKQDKKAGELFLQKAASMNFKPAITFMKNPDKNQPKNQD